MSTTPDEQEHETEESEHPDAPERPDDDESRDEPGQTPAQAAASEGSADVAKKLERAITDQRKRLGRILGVELEGSECPACGGMGYTQGPKEDVPEPVHPDNLVTCQACNGYGEVITGSRHPNHITAMCIECSGNGFKTVTAQPTNVTPISPAPPTPTSAQMGQLLPDGRFLPFGATEPVTISHGA